MYTRILNVSKHIYVLRTFGDCVSEKKNSTRGIAWSWTARALLDGVMGGPKVAHANVVAFRVHASTQESKHAAENTLYI